MNSTVSTESQQSQKFSFICINTNFINTNDFILFNVHLLNGTAIKSFVNKSTLLNGIVRVIKLSIQ
jgi:hypothetical protein